MINKWVLSFTVAVLFIAGSGIATPYFLLDSRADWQEALGGGGGGGGVIAPVTPPEWSTYIAQWNNPAWREGEPYAFGATVEFSEALLVSPVLSEPAITPHDDGLAMIWKTDQQGNLPPGNYASAWKWTYGLDPDLTNCTIQVTITPKQFGPTGQINSVSFGIQDAAGAVRSWWWSCGPGMAIPWNVPTTVTINTAKVGVAAATPVATGYVNNPAFNIKQSVNFVVDENAIWNAFQPLPVPQFGVQVYAGLWNYWHNVLVTANTSGNANKGTYVKYSQPPVVINPGQIPCKILGWDELSVSPPPPQSWQWPIQIMADDWLCTDERPVTDIHWWGSFIGWTQPFLPPVIPQAFQIGIWSDVPAYQGTPPMPFSHPGVLLWTHTCTNWVWNFAGYDVPPAGLPGAIENEACFQFNQLLSEPDWFQQEPGENIYWLSVAAIYPAGTSVLYPWGWKTREHFYQDDAMRITGTNPWPPVVGSQWTAGQPVEFPTGTSWDLTFEITTNVQGYCDNPIPGDINCDKIVDLTDFGILSSNWLSTSP